MAVVAVLILAGLLGGCSRTERGEVPQMTPEQVIAVHVAAVAPLQEQVNRASWNASISGKAEDYTAAATKQLALEHLYADPTAFQRLSKWKQSPTSDPRLRRQLHILYLEYLDKQIPQELLDKQILLQNNIDKVFSTFRATIGGQPHSENDLQQILKTSRDSRELQAAWEASKQVGEVLAPALRELVRLRNEAAHQLGYDNYFSLQLVLQDFDEKDFLRLFDDLDALTRKAFAARKLEVDERLARRYRVRPEQLRPWHYQDPFFQQAPAVFDVDLEAIYQGVDILAISQRYFESMGMEIEPILSRSDLYEQAGKNPHAYCTDIDRQGDVRVFANVRNNEYWMGTMLHELGHAVYDQYIDAQLPWVLREVPHTLNTEAVAMLFGRMSKNAAWIAEMLELPEERAAGLQEELQRMLTFEQLLFSRWVQVMMRFEHAMYADPEQDLNDLWWNLVERYQGLTRPENRHKPDYAAKYHIAMAPVYYHNYLLGELMASQVHAHIAENVVQQSDLWSVTYAGRRDVGDYLRDQIFAPGAVYGWNELIRRATGESLSPRAFAAQFVLDNVSTR